MAMSTKEGPMSHDSTHKRCFHNVFTQLACVCFTK